MLFRSKEQYLDLLQQEREKDAKEGKAWLDITGRTNTGASLERATLATITNQTSEGEDGGNL